MASPNIAIDSQLNSNDYTVPAGIDTVTFNSAVACTICFQEAETFGITSLDIAAEILVTLTLAHPLQTMFEPVPLGNTCPQWATKVPALAVHTIGMDSRRSPGR